MFDDLHDPDPPTADSSHFADVSERAHTMRTRRYALFGAASLAGVVAVGALAFAATSGGDDDIVVSPADSADPGEPIATVGTTTTTTIAAPVTTADPGPPIVVTTTIPPTTTETPAAATTTTEPVPATDPPPVTTEPPLTTTTAPTTTVPPAPTPIAGPFVAIDGDGDAVLLADSAAPPVLLFDGSDPDEPGQEDVLSVDVATVTPDGSTAWIGSCCEPAAGSIFVARPPTPATGSDAAYFGLRPAVDASGTQLATGDISGAVVVYDIGGDPSQGVRSPEPATPFTVVDVAWTQDDTVIALGIDGPSWVVRAYRYDGTTLAPLGEGPVAGSEGGGDYELGGITPLGGAIVHQRGSSEYQTIPLADGDSATTVALPGPALNMWQRRNDPLVWVDEQRTLRIGDQIVPGEYIWARR